jgi:sialate O-acetylesterase
MYKRYLFCFTLLLFFTAIGRAAIILPHYFGDHMVLQRDKPVSIWGWGTRGERIQLIFKHKRMQGKVGDDGKWKIMLPAVPAGGPYQIELHSTGQTIMISDVLFGDVWLCSGQSNMNFRMIEEQTFARELSDCQLLQLRLLDVKRASAVTPQADIKPSEWKTCNAGSLKEFPAVAYFFAKQIVRDIHVPVAIVHASWGGSPLETFLGKEGFSEFPAIKAKINSLGPDFIEETRAINKEISGKWEQRFYQAAAVLTADSNLNRQAAFFDSGWKSILVPGYLEEQVPSARKGITWYRRSVSLPREVTDSVEVYLGRINYAALTFVNGKLIGKQLNNWADSRFRFPHRCCTRVKMKLLCMHSMKRRNRASSR